MINLGAAELFSTRLLTPAVLCILLSACVAAGNPVPDASAPERAGVTGYALLVVGSTDTNAAVHPELDPVDRNALFITLVRIYKTLVENGYEDENIFVLYCDGKTAPDWKEKAAVRATARIRKKHFGKIRAADVENIQGAMKIISERADSDDRFVFYMGTHGLKNGSFHLEGSGFLSKTEFCRLFSGLKSRSNTILLDSCYSGLYAENPCTPNAVFVSTTSEEHPAWVDRSFSNCAAFIEARADDSFDSDGNGYTGAREAFAVMKERAEKYIPEWKEYVRTKYRVPKKADRSVIENSNLVPRMGIGGNYEDSPLKIETAEPVKAPL